MGWDNCRAHTATNNTDLRATDMCKMYVPILNRSVVLRENVRHIDDLRVTHMYKMYMPFF